MWLVGVGGIYGCGYWVYIVVRRYIDFLILLIPTPLVSVLFYSSIRRKKKKNDKWRFFYFTRCVRKLALYSDVIHLFDWKSAVEHDGGVLKCVIVYLA